MGSLQYIAPAILIAGLFTDRVCAQPIELTRSRGFNHSESNVSPPQTLYSECEVWGANVIRMHIWDSAIPSPFMTNWPTFLNELDKRVGFAQASGIKVIINLKFTSFDNLKDMDNHPFWLRSDLVPNFTKIWKDIAERLKKYGPTVYAYDIFNEPLDWSVLPVSPPQWRHLAVKVVQAIREVDKDVWIMYEPGPGGVNWAFSDLTPLSDRKVIYSPHFYQPQNFTHQGVLTNPKGVSYPGNGWDKAQIVKELSVVREFQQLYDVPIMIGEFSVSSEAPLADAQRWFDDVIPLLEEYKWSWLYHGWRDAIWWDMEKGDSSLVRRVQGTMQRNKTPTLDTYNTRLEAPNRYEAEYAVGLGAGVKANESYEFTGGGYVSLTGAGSFCKWDNVLAAETGNHELSFTFAAASGAARPVDVFVNGVSAGSLDFPVTGSASIWRIVRKKVKLNAGKNVVQVTSSSAATLDLDNLIVTKVSSAPFLEHDFRAGQGALVGWTAAGSTMTGEAWGARVLATGSDAKIYRALTLKKGSYLITVQTLSATLVKIQDATFKTTYYERKIQSVDAARHVSEPLNITEDGDKRVVIQVNNGAGKESMAFMIRVDSAAVALPVTIQMEAPIRFAKASKGPIYAQNGMDVELYTELSKAARAHAVIYRSTGARVAEMEQDSEGKMRWNQRDTGGRLASRGMYWYRIIGNGGEKSNTPGNWIVIR